MVHTMRKDTPRLVSRNLLFKIQPLVQQSLDFGELALVRTLALSTHRVRSFLYLVLPVANGRDAHVIVLLLTQYFRARSTGRAPASIAVTIAA